MAQPIVWHPRAVADLRDIAGFIERDSLRHAVRTVATIVRRVERLSVFPRLGRVVPEFRRPEIRELIWRSYRIVYHLTGSQVQILAVVHGARRIEDLLDF